MTVCIECKNTYKVITRNHLKKHYLTLDQYIRKYPNAVIRDPFQCVSCEMEVKGSISSRQKYCKECGDFISRQTVLKNVRKYNHKKKIQTQKWISYANKEHGIVLDEQGFNTTTRIDQTHTAWDYIPGLQKTLGTISENQLNVNSDGRVKEMVRLEREIRKIRDSKKPRNN